MTAQYVEVALRFKALAHPVRLQILDILRRGEACVCHIETVLGKRQAYISQQLIVLREAGLVEPRKDGLQVFYRLVDPDLEILLNATLGPATEAPQEVIAGCPCPHCESSRSLQILNEENSYQNVDR
jgi:DNA-binding transcriptional ArsR family regulator